MTKKTLKFFLRVFICLVIVYGIYIVSNVIYANYTINIMLEDIEEAIDNGDSDSLNELIYRHKIYSFESDIRKNSGKEGLKNFSYKKVKTGYFLGTVYWKYDIYTADPKSVFESGTYVNELENNFDEIYIKERQIQKKIAKKSGTYEELSEVNDGSFERFNEPDTLDEKSYYTLLEMAVHQDEKLYSGNATKISQIQIEYNIFTHEFENVEKFLELKNGELLVNSADEIFKKENIEDRLWDLKMVKAGEKPLNIIMLDERFVSLYEEAEDAKIENNMEKYIIENNLSSEEIEKYLIDQGYMYGRSIYLINEKADNLEVIFDNNKLVGFKDEENSDFIKEKMDYFVQNNMSKMEILKELETLGYYNNEEVLYVDPEISDVIYVVPEYVLESEREEIVADLESKGYILVEKMFFYKPKFGYIEAEFYNDRFIGLFCGNNAYLKEKREYFFNENLTKDKIIAELANEGFVVEN